MTLLLLAACKNDDRIIEPKGGDAHAVLMEYVLTSEKSLTRTALWSMSSWWPTTVASHSCCFQQSRIATVLRSTLSRSWLSLGMVLLSR